MTESEIWYIKGFINEVIAIFDARDGTPFVSDAIRRINKRRPYTEYQVDGTNVKKQVNEVLEYLDEIENEDVVADIVRRINERDPFTDDELFDPSTFRCEIEPEPYNEDLPF